MKVFYLAQVNFGCVVYADNQNDAVHEKTINRYQR